MHALSKVIPETFCHVGSSSLSPTCLCLSPCRGVRTLQLLQNNGTMQLILISGEGDSFLVADKIEVVSPYDLPFASFFVFYIPSRL